MKKEHLLTQQLLVRSLPGAKIEAPLPRIRRRADVFYPTENVVFEVQCSPIRSVEVMRRFTDYAAAGYRLIWVLHDSLYNKEELTSAELAMQGRLHLFSEIDAQGAGAIYEQRAKISGKRRYSQEKKHALFGTLKKENLSPLQKLLKKFSLDG